MCQGGLEVPNADNARCSHCSRLLSRKWLYRFASVDSSIGDFRRIWYCTGMKSKSQCRDKARRTGAQPWDGTGTSLVVARSSASQLTPLGNLMQSALKTNDSAMLSQVLLLAHTSGLTVSEAFALTSHQLTPRPVLLPPRMAHVFHSDAALCIAGLKRGDKMLRTVSLELTRRYGVAAHDLKNHDFDELMRYFCPPEDAARVAFWAVQVVKKQAVVSAEAGGQLVSVDVRCPAIRFVDPDTGCLYPCSPVIMLDVQDRGEEFCIMVCWPAAESLVGGRSGSVDRCASKAIPESAEVGGFRAKIQHLLTQQNVAGHFEITRAYEQRVHETEREEEVKRGAMMDGEMKAR